jgi:hydrogenase/urease accessory protein HupE
MIAILLEHALTAIEFRLSWWLIIDVNSVLGLLHCVVVGNVANVSEVHTASSFRIQFSVSMSCCVCMTLYF